MSPLLLFALGVAALAIGAFLPILCCMIAVSRIVPPPATTDRHWARCLLIPRGPDETIGPPDNLYVRRWYIIPKNHWRNVYLHHFLRSDDDRALHDHPWANISILLRGAYVEVTPAGRVTCWPFRPVRRLATAPHRVELIAGRPVWSLFITGTKQREWGFYCPAGWRHWREFSQAYPGGNKIGRGCE